MIVHEDSAFGAGLAKLLNAQLPSGASSPRNHSASDADRDFNNVVLRSRRRIPISSFRPTTTMSTCFWRVPCSSRRSAEGHLLGTRWRLPPHTFVKEFPEAAQFIMDCNHWFDPKSAKALAFKKKIEAKGSSTRTKST